MSFLAKAIFPRLTLLAVLVLALCHPLLAQETAAIGIGLPQDWSTRRVIFTNGASPQVAALAARDPRSWISWLRHSAPRWSQAARRSAAQQQNDPSFFEGTETRQLRKRRFGSRIDWAVSLGPNGGMPIGETPAQFSFDINGQPDCLNDFVVFVVDTTPGIGSQANIVAMNNLYSGPPPNTCGTNPTFMWSYAVGNGAIYLSPVLSLDGKKVAFVEASNPNPTLNVLTWISGQGTDATTGSVAPGTGGSSVASVDFTNTTVAGCAASPAGDSNSSPYVDYANDVAYVAADNGILYRIKGVFNGTPALDYCVKVLNGTARLTSPVFDSVSGKVFVSDGRSVYAFIPGANSFTPAGSIRIAGAADSIVLSLMVDSTNGFVYVFSSHDLTNANVVVSQMPVSLASHSDAFMGPAFSGQFILDGDFDNKYYDNGPAVGSLYACGTQSGANTKPALYTLSFQADGTMNTTPVMSDNRNINSVANPNGTCSPLVEFFDGTSDRLFVGVGAIGSTAGANLVTMWSITNRITSSNATPAASATNELGGTSAFSVDNNSLLPQASSIYFGTLAKGNNAPCGSGLYCAVKLTQAALK